MAFLSLILLMGCQPFRLLPPPEGGETAWPGFLGDPSRVRAHHRTIAPPLELLWRKRLSSGIGLSAACWNGLVALPTAKGEVNFLRIADGKRIGQVKYAKTALSILWPDPSSLVVIAKTGKPAVACYDLRQGAWRWKQGNGLVDAEPLAISDTVLVAFTFGKIRAYSLADGSLFWESDIKRQVHASPCAASGYLFVGTDDGHLIALHRRSGEKAWQAKLGQSILASPVTWDSLIFVGTTDSLVTCLRETDGQQLWKRKVPGRVRVAVAVVPEARILLVATSGRTVLALSCCDGSEIWKCRLEAPAGAPPLVTGSVAWIGALNRKLYALDLRSGEVIWNVELKGAVRSALLPSGDVLIVPTEDYYVYAFRSSGEVTP